MQLNSAGYQTVLHIYDEIIIEHPSNDLEAVLTNMAKPVPWAPGLILKGGGFITAKF